jgi:hypothetical protein
MKEEMTKFKININLTKYKKNIDYKSHKYKEKRIFRTYIYIKKIKSFKAL